MTRVAASGAQEGARVRWEAQVGAGPSPVAADVCLLLEGSYPYTKGGVGEWTHLLIQRMPQMTFHLWCILPDPAAAKPVYALPPNVVGMTNVFLFGNADLSGPQHAPAAFWQAIRDMHALKANPARRAEALWTQVMPWLRRLSNGAALDALLLSREAYAFMLEVYRERASTLPFLDYFYTVLMTHLPLLRLLLAPIPKARLYHAISTGYAGFLAARARRETGRPMILTEHGVYTNERQIELLLATWIHTRQLTHISINPETASLKRVWMEVFRSLGQLTYDEASRIYTIFQGNAELQRSLGADPSRIELIPNGVDVNSYASLPRRTDPAVPTVGLVGRVVAIKDIRTFIRACRVIADRFAHARFLVMGPTDAEEGYYRKCLEYRRQLGLEASLEFTGSVQLTEYYPSIDVVALTSISEGLPLSILEAMACGIPVVATRVGGSEELLQGRELEDQRLGPAGLVVGVGDHKAVGEGIVRILSDRALAARFKAVGPVRVRRYYDVDRITERYFQEYTRWIGARPD